MDATRPERWIPIPGFEETHEVSDQGRVRSLPRETHYIGRFGPTTARFNGKILNAIPRKGGYLHVALVRKTARQPIHKYVHRLVLESFVGPCPEGMEACHNNGNPADNRLENLRWDTRSANAQDVIRHGRNYELNQTHCRQGHEFTEENTLTSKGHRTCRTCNNAHHRRLRANFSPDKYTHGTTGTYARGCRCAECRSAKSKYSREYYLRTIGEARSSAATP